MCLSTSARFFALTSLTHYHVIHYHDMWPHLATPAFAITVISTPWSQENCVTSNILYCVGPSGRKTSATPNGTPEPTVAGAAAAMKAGRSSTGERGTSVGVPQSGEDEMDDEGSAEITIKAEDDAGGDGMESSDENAGRWARRFTSFPHGG